MVTASRADLPFVFFPSDSMSPEILLKIYCCFTSLSGCSQMQSCKLCPSCIVGPFSQMQLKSVKQAMSGFQIFCNQLWVHETVPTNMIKENQQNKLNLLCDNAETCPAFVWRRCCDADHDVVLKKQLQINRLHGIVTKKVKVSAPQPYSVVTFWWLYLFNFCFVLNWAQLWTLCNR